MEALIVLLVSGGIIAVILVGAASLRRSQRPKTPKIAPDWEPPNADPLPYYAKKYFFSLAERAFYLALKEAVPSSHTIFAKVRIADLLSAKKGSGWQSHFNRISCKHADFVLCDLNLCPVLVIELDDSSHDREERKDRDVFVDRAFAAARMPILHVKAKRDYQTDDMLQLLRPYIPTTANGPAFALTNV